MRDDPIGGVLRLKPDVVEHSVLGLLLDEDSPGVWSIGEIARVLGSESHAVDALVSLHMAGLVHRFGEFVFASHAAVRCWTVARAV